MTWAIVKPRDAWVRQAKRLGRSRAQVPQDAPLRDLATFALLIEALAALTPGQVSQELQDLATLRPVGAVLGMPDRDDARLAPRDDDDDVEDW